jgi:hypothetical protein
LRVIQRPVDVMAATEGVPALREAGVIQLVDSEQGNGSFAMTNEGIVVLRWLGAG